MSCQYSSISNGFSYRLRRTGVVNVENPVATAAREGRLGDDVIDGKDRVEELDD
jgi:hypothetical protein